MAHIITSRDRIRTGRRPQWPYAFNADSPITRDLFLWYPFGAGGAVGSSARALDFCAHRQDLAPQGAPTWIGDEEMGLVATTDYTVPDYFKGSDSTDYYGGLSEYSIALWVKLDATPAATGQLFGRGSTYVPFKVTVTNNRFSLENRVTGTAGIPNLFFITHNLPVGLWHHIAFSYRDGTINGYGDGELCVSPTQTGTLLAYSGSTRLLGVFAAYDGTSPAQNARIADIRLWRRALSAGEIAALYDPATRWDLYYPLGRRRYVVLGAGTGDITATAETGEAAAAGVAVDAEVAYVDIEATAETGEASAAGVAVDARLAEDIEATAETGEAAAEGVAVDAELVYVDIEATAETGEAAAEGVSVIAILDTEDIQAVAETGEAAAVGVAVGAEIVYVDIEATAETGEAAATGVAVDAELDTGDIKATTETALAVASGVPVVASGGRPSATTTPYLLLPKQTEPWMLPDMIVVRSQPRIVDYGYGGKSKKK